MKKALNSGMNKDVLAIGGLLLTLFLLMVITAITFVGGDELKETLCETNTAGYSWNNSACWTNTDANISAEVDSVTHVETIEAVVLVVLGLLTLVVIVGLFAIVIRAAIGFAKSF